MRSIRPSAASARSVVSLAGCGLVASMACGGIASSETSGTSSPPAVTATPTVGARGSVDAGSMDASVAIEDPSAEAGPSVEFGVDAEPSKSFFDGGTCVAATSPDGGCDTQSDPHNCGSCGNDCNGGACESGVCGPLPAGILATDQMAPIAIAIDSANVYWLNEGPFSGPGGKIGGDYPAGQVMKCAIAGCGNNPTILASGWRQPGGLGVVPSGLMVDNDNVYWVGSSEVFSCAIGGCGCLPQIIGSGGGAATGVTATAGNVYWTMYDVGQVAVCPSSGCLDGPSILASSQVGPSGITFDANHIYWTNTNGSLVSSPFQRSGVGTTVLWTGQAGSTQAQTDALAVDAQNLYWTNGNPEGTGSVMKCKKSACEATLVTLADARSSPEGIAVDGTTVYWTEQGGVYKCAIGGCNDAPTFVTASSSQAIAIDAAHIYLVQSGASEQHVMMVDK
jgi:hypothetical protein